MSPSGFEFDIANSDTPFISDSNTDEFNADTESVKFDKLMQE